MNIVLIHPQIAPVDRPYYFTLYEHDFPDSLRSVFPHGSGTDGWDFDRSVQELPGIFQKLGPLAASIFGSRLTSCLTSISDGVNILFWLCARGSNPEEVLTKFRLVTPKNVTERIKLSTDEQGALRVTTTDPISIGNSLVRPFESPRSNLLKALQKLHGTREQAFQVGRIVWALPAHSWSELLYRLKHWHNIPRDHDQIEPSADLVESLSLEKDAMAFAEIALSSDAIRKLTETERAMICTRCFENNWVIRCADKGSLACNECQFNFQTCSWAQKAQARVIVAGLGVTLPVASVILKSHGATRTAARVRRAIEVEQLLRYHDPIIEGNTEIRLASRFFPLLATQFATHQLPSPDAQLMALRQEAFATDDAQQLID